MTSKGKRLETIDTIRGITMISMIIYHLCWDLKFIKGFSMPWYGTFGTYLWQQSICWTFIIISGFCMHFARQPLRNGAIVFLCGFIVTCITLLALPESPVYFGVLTMLGSSMLLLGCYLHFFRSEKFSLNIKIEPLLGLVIFTLLFAATKSINSGYLSLGALKIGLPESLYTGGQSDGLSNMHLTYLGFMQNGFYSSDYFSLMPWFFLFMVGYFLYGLLEKYFETGIFHVDIKPLSWLGKHSLIVYMIHQPILYGVTMLIGK